MYTGDKSLDVRKWLNAETFNAVISNASDALSRLQFEMLTNRDVLDPDAELKISVECDKDARTITVRAADGSVCGYLSVPGGSEVELGLHDLPPGTYEIISAESPDADPLRLHVGEVRE